jgi:hypothetical protein
LNQKDENEAMFRTKEIGFEWEGTAVHGEKRHDESKKAREARRKQRTSLLHILTGNLVV